MDAPSEKVNSEAAESMSTAEKTDERETQHCCPSGNDPKTYHEAFDLELLSKFDVR